MLGPGFQFAIVDVMVENQGEQTREIANGLLMSLKDQKYTLHLSAQAFTDAGLPDDEPQPREKVRGQISFHLPEAAQGLSFVFDASITDYSKVMITLPQEPTSNLLETNFSAAKPMGKTRSRHPTLRAAGDRIAGYPGLFKNI